MLGRRSELGSQIIHSLRRTWKLPEASANGTKSSKGVLGAAMLVWGRESDALYPSHLGSDVGLIELNRNAWPVEANVV